MAYSKDGYPTELANKVGHIKIIQDPMIQRMIECFEDYRPLPDGVYPDKSGQIDLAGELFIDQVITVDGGHQTVPNTIRPERQVGFIQVVSQMIKLETIDYLRSHPMADPRDVQKTLGRLTHHIIAAVPVAGIHMQGMSLKDSIREGIHRYITHYDLYKALSFWICNKILDKSLSNLLVISKRGKIA